MDESLYELLRQCTARVSLLGKPGHGTGFFVAPGLLLTCAHVVKSAQSPSDEVQVFWNRHSYGVLSATIVLDADLALLRVDLAGHPCVWFTKEALPFDSLYSYGYPDTNPAGDPATFLLEGKAGQVRPGQSGAPLLNINSGYVCGIVQLTRGRASDLGGRAIPTSRVFQVFPELEALQRQYHRVDQQWMNCLWAYSTRTPRGKDRQWMLKRVRAFWITGVLEQSLYNASLIALGLQEKPDVVDNPWRLVMQESERPERLLPPSTSITEIYDSSQGELLILGEPGSGKTTLLLELARDLLERARLDKNLPIPVILNLSSWVAEQKPLTDWLIRELNTKYQVPRKLGTSWVEQDQLLLLLDGLDEVAPESRVACVNALNLYRKIHGSVPVVVCSRKVDYMATTNRVQLRNAVIVQPLTREQIDEYVASAAGQLEAVRQALLDDPSLQELVETPLMLSVLALAYQGESVENLLAQTSLPARRRKVFEKYVEQVLSRRQVSPRYTPAQTIQWLTWLARQMRQHKQTVFRVERLLKPDWFVDTKGRFQRSLASLLPSYWLSALVWGIAFGLPSGLLCVPIIGWSGFLPMGLLFGLLSGPVFAIYFRLTNYHVDVDFSFVKKRPSPRPNGDTWRFGTNGLLCGLIMGLAFGLVAGVIAGSISGAAAFGWVCGFATGGVIGLAFAWFLGLGTFIQHFLLRFLLWQAGLLPWKLVPFLDEATDRLLLRKVGKDYLFIHQLLLEYFAMQELQTASGTPLSHESVK